MRLCHMKNVEGSLLVHQEEEALLEESLYDFGLGLEVFLRRGVRQVCDGHRLLAISTGQET